MQCERADEHKCVILASPEFAEFLPSLPEKRRNEICSILEVLKEDPARGDSVRRNLWSKLYVKSHGINNLFRIELSGGWRMMYTVLGTRQDRKITILEVLDHKKYDSRFGY